MQETKSNRLQPAVMDVGTNVWVKTKDATVWAAGEVVEYHDVSGLMQVRRFDTGEVLMRECEYVVSPHLLSTYHHSSCL